LEVLAKFLLGTRSKGVPVGKTFEKASVDRRHGFSPCALQQNLYADALVGAGPGSTPRESFTVLTPPRQQGNSQARYLAFLGLHQDLGAIVFGHRRPFFFCSFSLLPFALRLS
jgi:hypothetical protein